MNKKSKQINGFVFSPKTKKFNLKKFSVVNISDIEKSNDPILLQPYLENATFSHIKESDINESPQMSLKLIQYFQVFCFFILITF
jgi:hypothetical protein